MTTHDPREVMFQQRLERERRAMREEMYLDFKADLEHRGEIVRRDLDEQYRQRLADAEDVARRWREQAIMTHQEWEAQRVERERRQQEAAARNEAPRAPRRGQRNRVVFGVVATLDQPAQPLGDLIWGERHPGTHKAMTVTWWVAERNILQLAIDYTVIGGAPSDVKRMLDKGAKHLGVGVLDVSCDTLLREPLQDD